MPWLPDVHALVVVTMRPVRPKNTPMLTAAVCDIILMYVLALMPAVDFSVIMRPKSPSAGGEPADEPYDTPMRPLPSNGLPIRPASASASSLARVAINATRPMLRVDLRL